MFMSESGPLWRPRFREVSAIAGTLVAGVTDGQAQLSPGCIRLGDL